MIYFRRESFHRLSRESSFDNPISFGHSRLQAARKEVMEEFQKAEQQPKPNPMELFEDVYDKLPKHLVEQRKQMEEHVKAHQEHYPFSVHKPI